MVFSIIPWAIPLQTISSALPYYPSPIYCPFLSVLLIFFYSSCPRYSFPRFNFLVSWILQVRQTKHTSIKFDSQIHFIL